MGSLAQLQRKTTFIVGAGASAEFGLPTGKTLVKQIEEYCDLKLGDFGVQTSGDILMLRAIKVISSRSGGSLSVPLLFDVAQKVRQNMGLAPSIDNFLGSRGNEHGWSEVGKLAIARSILSAEHDSKLCFESRGGVAGPSFASFTENWLTNLFRVMVTRKDRAGFLDALSSCRFVTFNYDRVIEQFFHYAIRSYFGLTDSEVNALCREHLSVVHVYGSLGSVECGYGSGFGCINNENYLVEASARIRVFSDGVDDASQVNIARSWISGCSAIFFLGFGFLPLNLRTLAPEGGERYRKPRVIGTSFGMSRDNMRIAESILTYEWFGGVPTGFEFEPVHSSNLIQDYALYLSEQDISN